MGDMNDRLDSGQDMSHGRSGRRPRGSEPLSIVREIVLNMSILIFAAVIMISLLIFWTNSLWVDEYAKYTPFFIIPYVVLFAVAVAFFGGRLISRLILKPVRELLEATRRVAEGDLSARVDIRENAEMQMLGDAFNQMTERLSESRRRLELSLDEMKRLNQDLSRTQRELIFSEKLASVGRLAAGVAHEIGNPLSSMAGYLEILRKRSYLRPNDRDMLERMESEVARINEIIKELLDYSRPQEDAMEMVDINQSVESSLTLISGHKAWNGVTVEKELSRTRAVRANGSSIKQLIMNLALNAAQAMEGKGKVRIITRSVEAGGVRGVELVVEDTGPGIPAGDLERVFEPFFTTKPPGHGTGLGLSICQRIVENFKGSIRAESEEGKGASFIVWLPAAGEEDGRAEG